MQQKYYWIIYIIALVGIISISGCVTPEGTSDKVVYKADKDIQAMFRPDTVKSLHPVEIVSAYDAP